MLYLVSYDLDKPGKDYRSLTRAIIYLRYPIRRVIFEVVKEPKRIGTMGEKNADSLPQTLLQAVQYFADEDIATQFVAEMRWPDGEQVCPKCGSVGKHYFMKTRKRWKCRDCRHQFSVKVGTIFEGSPIKLSKWMPAVWMLANSKNGISSYELARALGVTQKTAWFMLHRIREAMKDDANGLMDGETPANARRRAGAPRLRSTART